MTLTIYSGGFVCLSPPIELPNPLTNFAFPLKLMDGIRPGVPAGMPGYLFGVAELAAPLSFLGASLCPEWLYSLTGLISTSC